MSSSAARARDEDQLVVGGLLPAVHGRFTSPRSYLSPDLSSSYKVASSITSSETAKLPSPTERAATTERTGTGGSCQNSRIAPPKSKLVANRALARRREATPNQASMRRLLQSHRRFSTRASSSALPLLRLPTVLFPSQPLSLRLTPSDAEQVGSEPLFPDAAGMSLPAELVNCAWRDFDGKVVAVSCGHVGVELHLLADLTLDTCSTIPGVVCLTGLQPQPRRLKVDLPLTRASSAFDRCMRWAAGGCACCARAAPRLASSGGRRRSNRCTTTSSRSAGASGFATRQRAP